MTAWIDGAGAVVDPASAISTLRKAIYVMEDFAEEKLAQFDFRDYNVEERCGFLWRKKRPRILFSEKMPAAIEEAVRWSWDKARRAVHVHVHGDSPLDWLNPTPAWDFGFYKVAGHFLRLNNAKALLAAVESTVNDGLQSVVLDSDGFKSYTALKTWADDYENTRRKNDDKYKADNHTSLGESRQ